MGSCRDVVGEAVDVESRAVEEYLPVHALGDDDNDSQALTAVNRLVAVSECLT